MSRVIIEFNGNFHFATHLPIMMCHINSGQHLGFDFIVSYLGEARMQFLRNKGVNEYKDYGYLLVAADLAVVYQSEAKYGETLKIEVAPMNFHSKGFDLFYRVTEAEGGRAIAMAKTAHILFDPSEQKSVALPALLLEKLDNPTL